MVLATHILCVSNGAYFPWSNFVDKSSTLIDVQVDLNDGTKILRPQLDLAIQSSGNADAKLSWCNSAFFPLPNGGEFGAGVLNMSPGWFQLL